MRIAPPVGFSNPEISRRQVVLPDPDGPSIAKNDPSAMVRSTASTAFTAPKWRLTDWNSTAGIMAQTNCRVRIHCAPLIGKRVRNECAPYATAVFYRPPITPI